jgi:hypothetical protein
VGLEAVEMGQRTGNRRRVITITLLIAIPAVLAVWLGLGLMRPASAQDELRAIPLLPGAIHVIYETPDDFSRQDPNDESARVIYVAKDSADAVRKFYARNLPNHGWKSTSGGQDQEVYFKRHRYVTGLRLREHAPWVTIQEGEVTSMLRLQTMRTRINGVEHTNVTVQLGVIMKRGYPAVP